MSGIFHRTSIRKYEKREVEQEKIERVLRAAMAAPSAMNQQPWEYYVVTNKETIQQLSVASPYASCIKEAPVVFVACYRKALRAPVYAHVDMSASVENLLLEVDEQGLGAVWIGTAPEKDRMQRVKEIIHIPDHMEAFAVIGCGYPAEVKVQEDRYEESRVHYIR